MSDHTGPSLRVWELRADARGSHLVPLYKDVCVVYYSSSLGQISAFGRLMYRNAFRGRKRRQSTLSLCPPKRASAREIGFTRYYTRETSTPSKKRLDHSPRRPLFKNGERPKGPPHWQRPGGHLPRGEPHNHVEMRAALTALEKKRSPFSRRGGCPPPSTSGSPQRPSGPC